MKEHRLKIIIVLMIVSIIGLLSIQFYWIKDLIRVEEERFHRITTDALMHVSNQVEKEEAAKTVIKKISLAGSNYVKFHADKMIKNSNTQVFIFDSTNINTTKSSPKIKYKDRRKIDSNNNRTKVQIMTFPPGKPGHPPPFARPPHLDSLMMNRKKLVQNIVTEIMEVNINEKIEDRVSLEKLNSLLAHEFRNSGINGEFYFGVNQLKKDSLTLLKKGTDLNELKKSDLRTMLFPEEMFLNRYELIVYFPAKLRYVFGSLVSMIGLSLGLILIIVWLFYRTVKMFLEQKQLIQLKNDLINNITHEFKTPISTISLACEALNEPELSSDKNSVSRYSGIIKEENSRLKLMVDQLLNTAALEKGGILIKEEKIDMHQIIRAAVSKFDGQIEQLAGEIDIKPDAGRSFIIGDAFHLTNIISNLIDNAIKYNEHNPEIIISTKNENNFIIVNIIDNGIGISKEYSEKIFDMFFRVSSGNIQNVRGNGIGLSYAKKIIDLHKGKISVESELSKGSKFQIIFPLDK
jgi:two-component system phosphate regulon sensor histidine kinase PhoR